MTLLLELSGVAFREFQTLSLHAVVNVEVSLWFTYYFVSYPFNSSDTPAASETLFCIFIR
jgi:hypothetical protein